MKRSPLNRETLQELLNEGLKAQDIADTYGYTLVYVYQLASKYKIKSSRNQQYTEEMLKEIQDLFNDGYSYEAVAQKLNTTRAALEYARRKYGLSKPCVRKPNKFLQVKHLYRTEHKSIQEIADIYGESLEEMQGYFEKNNYFAPPQRKMIVPHKENNVIEGCNARLDMCFYKCHECGKEFYVPDAPEYAYKINFRCRNMLYFCSWTCIQKFRNDNPSRTPMKHIQRSDYCKRKENA